MEDPSGAVDGLDLAVGDLVGTDHLDARAAGDDGHHVDRALWPLISRLKPADRLVLVSDAIPIAGSDATSGRLGTLEVEVRDGRATLAGTDQLGGSVLALDGSVREVAAVGSGVAMAVRAASANPAALLGLDDRGSITPGLRADLVELGDDLEIRRVMREGAWRDT